MSATLRASERAIDRPLAVDVQHVDKTFGMNLVLRDVSLAVPPGTARALVGRNGAGKSTLVGVITGLLAPDAGSVAFAGRPALPTRIEDDGRRQVACVYQKSTLIPTLSVAENLFVNNQPGRGALVDWTAMRRDAERIADEWDLGVDVDTETGQLRVEQRQIVEIARALRQGTRFLILDEPTAALESKEIERLFSRLNRLKQDGVTLLYISHHLQEIYDICDSVTVMRDGRVVADEKLEAMPRQAVVAAMVGEDLAAAAQRRRNAASDTIPPALRLDRLTLEGMFAEVSLSVGPGECLGLAGLGSSGKEEIAEAVAGLRVPSRGTGSVAGCVLSFGDVARAQRQGVSFVPRDRRRRGILPQLSIADNLTVTISERLGRAGVVWPRLRDRVARSAARKLDVVATSIEQPVVELSGGNQQKVVMGRALASDPKILVLVYPTQGVDVASKQALFGIVDEVRAKGTGVLLVSDEIDELRTCDRVLVIFKGRLTHAFEADWSERELIAAIEGV